VIFYTYFNIISSGILLITVGGPEPPRVFIRVPFFEHFYRKAGLVYMLKHCKYRLFHFLLLHAKTENEKSKKKDLRYADF